MKSRSSIWLKSYSETQMSAISNNKNYEKYWMMSDVGDEKDFGSSSDMTMKGYSIYYDGRSVGSVGVDRITGSPIGREIIGKIG